MGDNFGKGKFSPPLGILKLAAIAWWALDGFSATRHSNASQLHNHCMLQTNTSLYLPSAWYTAAQPASECAVKLLATHSENFAGGGISPLFSTAKFSPRNSPLRKFSPPPYGLRHPQGRRDDWHSQPAAPCCLGHCFSHHRMAHFRRLLHNHGLQHQHRQLPMVSWRLSKGLHPRGRERLVGQPLLLLPLPQHPGPPYQIWAGAIPTGGPFGAQRAARGSETYTP